ncbi:putative ribonuclease H-like domain-containing protein, partial [Tanacetum coccineum]
MGVAEGAGEDGIGGSCGGTAGILAYTFWHVGGEGVVDGGGGYFFGFGGGDVDVGVLGWGCRGLVGVQMDGDDLEELDLRWQVAMLTVRVKKFIQRTGRNMDFKEKRPVSLDKSKIECYNCHRKGHFARECRSGRNQGRRSYGDNGRSNAPTNESSSQALVAQDGLGGYDWSNDFEVEPVNYALMAISSSSSSSSSDSEIALESLESRILGHEKNELAWGEKYEFQNYELKCREIKINNLNLELEKVVKERDELKDKIAKWEESTKNLDEILNSQMSARDKTGLGYDTQLNELSSNHETDGKNSLSIFDVRSSDEENIPENDRFLKNGYKVVPPPITGNFLTPRADISFVGLDEYAIRNKIIESQTTKLNTKTSETAGKTNDANTEKPKSASESVVSNPKINRDRVIIEDWNSDDEEEMYEVQTVRPETQTVKTRDDKSGQNSQKQGISFRKVKACFVCKSTDHLIKDCNFHDTKSQEPKLKNVVNTGVLTRTGLHRPSVNTARPVCTARPSVSTARPVCTTRPSVSTARHVYATRPIYPRIDNVRPRGSCSPIKRSYYTKPAFRPKDLKQDVKTFRVQNMTTVGTRAVVNTGKGKLDTDLKKSRWVWRPKGNYLDHVSKDSGSFMLKKGNPEILLQDHAVVDSGCSSHMTGNKAYLSDYEDFNGGFVAFGSDPKGGKITGKGKIKTANLDFDDVYFVDFKNINKLVKGHLVRGLPLKVFVNDLTCVACKKGKQHKASCKAKLDRIIKKPLELLHMDLFGPVSVESINKKRYCLVVTDDFSRFSWVFFLATKDETSEILCNLIIGLEKQLNHNVKIIRCDNGTEFKNYAMNELCAKKGIKKEFSVARNPQQNGVAEKKNRTLIEAPRTMLADSLLHITFWAEAVNTACYVLNRVLMTKPQNKTPYELLIGKSPIISFMRPFGCPLTILNTLDSVGKFDGKSDEGYLLGYSTSSKAFRMFDLDFLTNSMNYIPVSVENQVNVDASTQDSYVAGSSRKDKGPTQEYILLPLQPNRTRIPVKDVVQVAQGKPSENSLDQDIQDSEDIIDKEGQHQMPKDEQVLHDELEIMVTQELAAKAMDDVSRQAFKEEKRRITSQKKAAQATSTNQLSTDMPSVNTDRLFFSTDRSFVSTVRWIIFVYLGGKIPIDASTLPNADLPIDPNMPALEDTSDTLPNDRIFNGAYNDDEDVGEEADFNNMDNTIARMRVRLQKDILTPTIPSPPLPRFGGIIEVTVQAKEIKALKAQVKKLKKESNHLSSSQSLDLMILGCGRDIGTYMVDEDDQNEGRTSSVVLEEKESADKEVSTEAPVSIVKPNKGTDKRNEGKSATQTAPTTTSTPTPTIFGDDETIEQVLITMSQNKQKENEKGVKNRNVEILRDKAYFNNDMYINEAGKRIGTGLLMMKRWQKGFKRSWKAEEEKKRLVRKKLQRLHLYKYDFIKGERLNADKEYLMKKLQEEERDILDEDKEVDYEILDRRYPIMNGDSEYFQPNHSMMETVEVDDVYLNVENKYSFEKGSACHIALGLKLETEGKTNKNWLVHKQNGSLVMTSQIQGLWLTIYPKLYGSQLTRVTLEVPDELSDNSSSSSSDFEEADEDISRDEAKDTKKVNEAKKADVEKETEEQVAEEYVT